MDDTLSDEELRQVSSSAIMIALGILVVEAVLLGLYHEEPTRLLVASSMLRDGHWMVPHILGEIYLRKPPGFNWIVALFSLVNGEVTALSGRSVAIASWLGLGGLMAWMTASFQHKINRVVSVLSVLLAVTVFVEKAALAEIDLFLSTVLFAAAAVWYKGTKHSWPISGMVISHLLLGFAVLTKGPVAFLFYAPVLVLEATRERSPRWGLLLSGFVLSLLPVGGWLWGMLRTISPIRFYEIVFHETAGRASGVSFSEYLELLVRMPLKTFFAFLPGTYFLARLLIPQNSTTTIGDLWSDDRFRMAVGGLVPFVFFWLFPDDSTRYVLPVVPWIGLMVGLLFERKDPGAIGDYLCEFNQIFGGLLVLVIALPWAFEHDERILSFPVELTVSLLISLAGLAIVLSSYWSTDKLKTGLMALISFFLVVKIGYLFLYVPMEKPAFIKDESRIDQYARMVQDRQDSTSVIHTSEHGLEIPFYFQQRGIRVEKVTGGQLDSRKSVITANKDQLDQRWVIKYYFRLSEGRTFYFYVPRDI